jgi:hypothetical protein
LKYCKVPKSLDPTPQSNIQDLSGKNFLTVHTPTASFVDYFLFFMNFQKNTSKKTFEAHFQTSLNSELLLI